MMVDGLAYVQCRKSMTLTPYEYKFEQRKNFTDNLLPFIILHHPKNTETKTVTKLGEYEKQRPLMFDSCKIDVGSTKL